MNTTNLIKFYSLALFCFLVIQSFVSCQTQQQKLQKKGMAPTVITYEKKRGRGLKKPVYTIEILDSKVIKYAGVKNVPIIGERIIDLDDKTYQQLMDAFKASDFSTFESVYKGRMRDLPLTAITYDNHSVTYQQEVCPEKLEVLAKLVEEAIDITELK